MTQRLWIVNSSLLLLFFLVLVVSELLRVEPPLWRQAKVIVDEIEEQEEIESAVSWAKIYQNDLFDTYVKQQSQPVKQSFVTPIPEPKQAPVTPPPELPKQDFVPALNITLKGIIVAGQEKDSVVMVADESGKETMYRLGQRIKDGQIIKVAHNRIVLLRANGQQEIFFLRKDDAEQAMPSPQKWEHIIRKVDDQNYEIDPTSFAQEVPEVGNFLERMGVIGMAYQQGQAIGMRIGTLEQNSLGQLLGLQANDIIKAVNQLDITDLKNRMTVYDTIVQLPEGGITIVDIVRENQPLSKTYKFVKMEKPKAQLLFGGPPDPAQAPGQAPGQEQDQGLGKLAMSPQQKREKNIRDFEQRHKSAQRHKQSVTDIRKRILENLQSRVYNSRSR
ncbi:MAG: hypothetical protein H6679_02015 [Epsilonproteobacteria bacterium]|nr:hypothetical protein [Campylobacterota bacterium]